MYLYILTYFTYLYIYILTYLYYLDFFLFGYTNVMELFKRFYSTVLEQKVLTCKNHIFFFSRGQFLFIIFIVMVCSIFQSHNRQHIDVYFPKIYKLRRYFCVLVLTLFCCPNGMINFFDRVSCFCLCHDTVIFFPIIISGNVGGWASSTEMRTRFSHSGPQYLSLACAYLFNIETF